MGFCRGGLAEGVRARAEEHIGSCDECRQLVSAVARSSFVEAPPRRAQDEDAERESERNAAEPRPLLRGRMDPAMAATTPVGGSGHAPPISPVQPGEILAGKFEVERVLGAGGMGIVVAARHTQLDQRVALKFLLPVACEVPGAVARFLREGKAAARITSEHVARVMDTGMLAGGAPYLVMEYLEGMDLGALLVERGPIPADEAIEYVLQACEAIVEAHGLGIVHRDLKPANLFLSHRADGSPLVKVLDFGISKVAGSGSRSQLTSASVLMGSPRYMSPEQMMSAKDVDARTDVWALGVILYELLTGKPVWHADTMQGLCALIASSPAPRLRALVPGAPEILEEVVARCLTKAVDDRIASIADLAQALEPVAPRAARTSIERILRVGRKERGVSTGPRASVPRSAAAPPSTLLASRPPASAQTGGGAVAAVASQHDARGGGAGRIGMVLGITVAVLLVAGIVVNAGLVGRAGRAPAGGSVLATSLPPPPALTVAPASSASPPAPSALPNAEAPPSASAASASPAPAVRKAARAAPAGPASPQAPEASSAALTAPVASSRALTDRK
ncbi:MAG TPA: serine/threonine-protein kinase [Labilithrix sp.]|nr:serine/threonine-protein kinase [Labilithrix sp.]